MTFRCAAPRRRLTQQVFVEGLLSSPNQTFALALTNVAPRVCGILPCTVSHGSGLLLNNGCQVDNCDPNYVIDDNMCMCVSQLSCGNSVFVQCNMASNSFPPCPGTNPPTLPANITQSSLVSRCSR